MKTLIPIMLLLCLTACETYDKRADGSISYRSAGTDSDAMVVDGPLPVLAGVIPIYNDKGVVVGQRPIYTAGASTEKVGFASFGRNQSRGLKTVTDLADSGIKTWGFVKSLTRYFDSEDATTAANAATEKAKLTTATEQAQIAADKEIALEAMKLEAPTP